MAKHGEVTITIERPIEAVFDFLADSENDKQPPCRARAAARSSSAELGEPTGRAERSI